MCSPWRNSLCSSMVTDHRSGRRGQGGSGTPLSPIWVSRPDTSHPGPARGRRPVRFPRLGDPQAAQCLRHFNAMCIRMPGEFAVIRDVGLAPRLAFRDQLQAHWLADASVEMQHVMRAKIVRSLWESHARQDTSVTHKGPSRPIRCRSQGRNSR